MGRGHTDDVSWLDAPDFQSAGMKTDEALRYFCSLREKLSEFWKAHGTQLRDHWDGLSEPQRRAFLLTNAPSLPLSALKPVSAADGRTRVDAAAQLCPEINLQGLLPGTAFPDLMQKMAAMDNDDMLENALNRVSELEQKGKLHRPRNEREFVTLFDGKSYNLLKPAPKVEEWLRDGLAVPRSMFDNVLNHMAYTVGVMVAWADEFKTSALHRLDERVAAPVMACRRCGGTRDEPKWCGRCKTTCYCSKACQVADWPAHKLICAPPVVQE
jgi:hypothetical protein